MDNTTAIRMSLEDNNGGRRKHIDVMHHHLRQTAAAGIVKPVWVATEEELADLLTKPLGQEPFERCRDAVLGRLAVEDTLG